MYKENTRNQKQRNSNLFPHNAFGTRDNKSNRKDVSREKNDIPKVFEETPFYKVLEEINSKKLGFTTVLDKNNKLKGTITDGDVRRGYLKFQNSISEKMAIDIMNLKPKTIAPEDLAVSALKIMEEYRISDLIVVDDSGKLTGIIDLKDLLKAGII